MTLGRGLQVCRLATRSSFPRGLHGKAAPRADARFHGTLVVGTANTDMSAVGASPAAATRLEAPCQSAGPHSLRLSHLPPRPRGSGKPALLPAPEEKPCLVGGAEVASPAEVFCSREQKGEAGSLPGPFLL